MKNRIITLLCIVCLFTGNEVCRAQVQEVISGVVRNESNEPLDGAIISVPDNPEYTTSSDKDGKFIMEIPSGASMVICKIPRYRNQTMKFTLNKPVEFRLISDIAGQDTSLEVADRKSVV